MSLFKNIFNVPFVIEPKSKSQISTVFGHNHLDVSVMPHLFPLMYSFNKKSSPYKY